MTSASQSQRHDHDKLSAADFTLLTLLQQSTLSSYSNLRGSKLKLKIQLLFGRDIACKERAVHKFILYTLFIVHYLMGRKCYMKNFTSKGNILLILLYILFTIFIHSQVQGLLSSSVSYVKNVNLNTHTVLCAVFRLFILA